MSNKINFNSVNFSDILNPQLYIDLISPSMANSFSFALQQLPAAITIYFLEQTQNQLDVETFGVGTIFYQAFGFSLINGLASGLQALVSQAIGLQKYQMCGKLYYQSLFLTTIVMLPIGLLLYYSTDILILMKINQELAVATGFLNKGMIVVIFFSGIFYQTKAFLNGQNIYHLQVYTHAISCLLSILFNYIFVSQLELELLGGIIARILLEISNNIILFYFIYKYDCCRETLIKFDKSCFDNMLQFVKTAVPIGTILWFESICFELFQIQVSYLSPLLLSVNVLMYTVALLVYQFSFGISIAATTLVGNQMGANFVKQARDYAISSIILLHLFFLGCIGLIVVFKNQLISFLSPEIEIHELFIEFLPLLIFQIISDGIQALISGICKAIGKEHFASQSMIILYMCIGQPLAYFLTFQFGFELYGIWIGMIFSAFTYSAVQIIMIIKSDWDELANLISHKISKLQDSTVTEVEMKLL